MANEYQETLQQDLVLFLPSRCYAILLHILYKNPGVLGAVCLRQDKKGCRTWHRHSDIFSVGLPRMRIKGPAELEPAQQK